MTNPDVMLTLQLLILQLRVEFVRVRAKKTSSDRRDNYRLHLVWTFDIIAVSDDVEQLSRKHPVWSTKLIAATQLSWTHVPRSV